MTPLDRLRAFFAEDIWAVPAAGGRFGRALLHRAGRVAYATGRGLLAGPITVRAAALTYYTALSLVPFLAFAFAILKGFGVYRAFTEATLRPWLSATFGENPSLLGAMERVLQFVDRTDVSALGVAGLVALVYTCISLLGSVEDALNETWGASTRRSFLRQVTDYVTLLVIGPLLVVVGAAAAAAAQSSSVARFLRERLELGPVIDLALQLAPVAVVAVAFFALYLILPNVRVRAASAALGAAVAASAWQAALVLYVRLQVGVSRFNALYSVLGAIPIFLVWTYVSWVVVLVGARVAASHQNDRRLRLSRLGARADQAFREALAVLVAARVARAFVAGVPWRGADELAELSPAAVEEILDALVRAGILARAATGAGPVYLPARDLDGVRVAEVREALRRDAEGDALRAELERRVEPGLLRLLQASEREARESGQNVTLRELAALAGPAAGPPASAAGRPRGPLGEQGRPVLDAK